MKRRFFMALTKAQKKKIIEDLKEKISRQKIMIFVAISGLKVKDLFDLRKRLRQADCQLQVSKKTLIRLAFKEKGIEIDPRKMAGEIALSFGFKDEILPAKIIYQFSQENPSLKILGGLFENKFREAEEIIILAQLPTREELLVKLVRSISAPVSNFVNVLGANLKNFIYLISQIKVKQ